MNLPTFLAILTLAVIAGGANAETIATVNGKAISSEMFEIFASGRLRKPAAEISDPERQALIEELIRMHVVAAEAEKKKLHKESALSAQLDLQRMSLLGSTLLQRHLTDNPVTDQQLQAAYDKRYATAQNEYKARHILVKSPNTATEVIEKLNGGADFAALAAEYSIGPSANNGGDLGWFSADQMVKPFSDAVAALAVGSYTSEPVQTQFGWHVIHKEDQRDLPAPDLASVRAELEQSVKQQLLQSYMEQLRGKSRIKRQD